MSAITGIISTNSNLVAQTTLQAMTDILSHRGPDGEGHYIASHVALGYRHFDVYNLTTEQAETMFFLNRYAVTFDGRIYNLPELQEELSEQGYSFDCLSEAQLLSAAYDYWGVDCLNKINGEWAFVLYDTQTENYFISRDRFGIKPLYYNQDKERFVFGSEIKAIHESGLVDKVPNKIFIDNYLKFGANVYEAPTAFANVFHFPFAHYFFGSIEQLLNQPEFTRYWKLSVNTSQEKYCPNKIKKIAKEYYRLLSDSVRIRMRGKVKVGASLSGGLDSSSIVYLMNDELKKHKDDDRLQTFSSVYKALGTEDCDESQFINLVADKLGVDSNQIEPNSQDVPKIIEDSVYANETLSDGIGVSNYVVAKMVKDNGYKVILNGQGADETLAGYSNFILDCLIDLAFSDFLKEFNKYINDVSKTKMLSLFIIKICSTVFGKKIVKKLLFTFFKVKMPGSLNFQLEASVNQGLVNLLHYAEHIPSSLGVETRTPFMDHRLIEFLADTPGSYKINNGWTKYIARKAFEDKLPNEIVWRTDKMGWPVPQMLWFNGELSGWLKSYIDVDHIGNLSEAEIVRRLNKSSFLKIFFNRR